MFVSTKVDDANKQLGKARDRNRESRIWLLVFLIGASLTLLCAFALPPHSSLNTADVRRAVLDSY